MTRMTEPTHITVVYAGQSEAWTPWIREQLEAAGHRTAPVRWNPLRRVPEPAALTDLMGPNGRILLVLDDWYLRFDSGRYGAWADVLREVYPAFRERLLAVSVTTRPLPPEVADLAPVALRGVGPEEARRRLLDLCGTGEDEAAPAEGGGKRRGVDLRRGLRFPDDLPEVWNVPRRNRRFTGREDSLARLHATFTAPEDSPASGRDTRVTALTGVSGVGKSQVALEYAHRHMGEYDLVWWVNATSRLTAREEFAALAAELGIADGDQLSDAISGVHRYLRSTHERWLIVFDGAEQPDRVEDLLPEGPGHVLVTSYRTQWRGHDAEVSVLDRFERAESVAYIRRRCDRIAEAEADELAAVLEDLPLLIAQMSAWLDGHPLTEVRAYIQEIREGDPHGFAVDDPRPFQAVWAKTVNTLREEAPEAHELLKLFSSFSPDPLPVRLLRAARPTDLPPHLRKLVKEPSSWNTAWRIVAEGGAMTIEYDDGPRLDILTVATLRMHQLFHRFVRGTLPAAERAESSRIACRVLVAAEPGDSPSRPGTWARYAELIPHLEPSGALDSADEDVRELVLNCIEYLRQRGEYRDGWLISKRALESWERTSGRTDRQVLVAAHQYANMLRRMGRFHDAEYVGRETLARVREHPEIGGIEEVRALNGLGGTLAAVAKYDEAHTAFARAAARSAELLGEDNVPYTLQVRSNLATTLCLQGRYQESYELHEEIREARVALFGGKHPMTLNSVLHTAWMLRLLGSYREALALQERNARLHSQVLDRNHTQTLHAEHNLALCMRREGNLQYARALMRRVRERLLHRRGSHHPETLLVTADYAMLLREAGDRGRAERLTETCIRAYETLLGEDHPYTHGLRANRALLLADAGDGPAALRLAEESLAGMEHAVGAEHAWTLGCALNTASLRATCGDRAGAASLGEQSLTRARRTMGDTHVLTLGVMAGLVQDLTALGRDEEAESLRSTSVERLNQRFFEEHRAVLRHLDGERPRWDFEPQLM